MSTATTAPFATRGGDSRLGALRRIFGPRIGGAPGSAERRAFQRFACVIPVANLCGAIDVFLFLWYVLPLPKVHDSAHVQLINTFVFLGLMPVTFVVAGYWSNRIAEPIADWLDSGRPASEDMLTRVLCHPLRQTAVSAAMWVVGAIVFGTLNAFYSPTVGILVAVAILLGGVTTCGVCYLLGEKTLRPITARALGECAPREPKLPGVTARVLIAFGVTAVGPLLAMSALGVVVLSGNPVSPTRFALTALVLAMFALVGGIFALKIVGRSLADPLQSVRGALARVESGDLDSDLLVNDGSEVGVLQAGFNSMVAGLREREQLRDLFGRHVGENVARAALERGAQLGGEQREAAALFVDLVGSTALASERSPDEVVALLNRFFALVIDVVHAHGGWVNKFEGDGALCVFGAPDDLEDPATCALSAARALDRRLRAQLPELAAGIGVSAGPVVAGYVGAQQRFEYTVIGDPVNEAARLMQMAKRAPQRVLAAHCMLERVAPGERSFWRTDGQAVLRGRSQATDLIVPAA
jgi:adenylate cyclase